MPTPQEAGAVAVGAQITYLVAIDHHGKPVQMGEFPHYRMRRKGDRAPQCRATINVTDGDGTSLERCTRERHTHVGLHVKHLAPGQPILAWRTDHPHGDVFVQGFPTEAEEGDAFRGEPVESGTEWLTQKSDRRPGCIRDGVGRTARNRSVGDRPPRVAPDTRTPAGPDHEDGSGDA